MVAVVVVVVGGGVGRERLRWVGFGSGQQEGGTYVGYLGIKGRGAITMC